MDTITLKIISYNLNWAVENYPKRINNLLELIKKNKPDVVIFQNIRTLLYEKIGREMKFIGYKKYLPENFQSRELGDIVFCNFPFDKFYFTEFQKNTNKKGVFILSSTEKKINICVTTLDSISYLQSYQIANLEKIIDKILSPESTVILAIDTSSLEYNDVSIIDGWYDAWYEMGTDQNKYTMNSETNHLTPKSYKDRPDRIWYRGKTIECKNYDLIGENLNISSHYGIMSSFSY